MSALETIQPYVEQLFDDDEVADQLSRAAANLRRARTRAGKAKSPRKAIADPELRHRLARGAQAAWAAGVAIQQGPEKRRRGHRRRQLVLLVLAGAATYAVVDRERLLGLVSPESGA